MKNVILATLFAFGLSALAQEPTAPAATGSEQPAASAPAAEHGAATAEHGKKDMKHDKKAKAAPKKKATKGE